MKTFLTWLLHPILTGKFAWHLWKKVKCDGQGYRIDFWYAVTWAADRGFWAIPEEENESQGCLSLL